MSRESGWALWVLGWETTAVVKRVGGGGGDIHVMAVTI